jgi:16S rRNA (cytosine967-C5)-methyltransferase
MKAPVRAVAARAVDSVIRRGTTLDNALAGLGSDDAPKDRALLRELSAGTLRFAPRLDQVIIHLTDRPIDSLQPMVRALLMVGLYQLMETRIPTHAAVDQTVRAAPACGVARAKGMINAVLRRYDREHEAVAEALAGDEIYATAHPQWLVSRVRSAWGDDADGALEAGNQRPPMWLRVAGDREEAVAAMSAVGIETTAPDSPASAVRLATPTDVHALPGFDRGEISVQDASAQFAAPLLDVQPGMRVLDACAAPGGKTMHLIQSVAEIDLVVIDVDEARLWRVQDNLKRIKRKATVFTADVREVGSWWDGRPFDRILLDAPCSGTGVIRRHPDIKVLRRESDIDGFVETQSQMMEACWKMLAPGGRLLYATCSILPEEGDGVVGPFLSKHDDASPLPIELGIGRSTEFGHQILSGEADQDGFHYACLERADSR